jgi:hypothetical protein
MPFPRTPNHRQSVRKKAQTGEHEDKDLFHKNASSWLRCCQREFQIQKFCGPLAGRASAETSLVIYAGPRLREPAFFFSGQINLETRKPRGRIRKAGKKEML